MWNLLLDHPLFQFYLLCDAALFAAFIWDYYLRYRPAVARTQATRRAPALRRSSIVPDFSLSVARPVRRTDTQIETIHRFHPSFKK